MDLFDDDTGQPTAEFLELSNKESALEVMREARGFQALSNTEGWTSLKKFLESEVDAHKNALVFEQRPTEILRLQSDTKAYVRLLNLVEQKVYEATALLQADPS